MFANNDVTIQWLPLSEKFVHKANRGLESTDDSDIFLNFVSFKYTHSMYFFCNLMFLI